MPTTPRMLLPTPAAGDPNDVPTDMLELATALDTAAAMYAETTEALRPAAGKAGRLWRGTDTRRFAWDTGAAWLGHDGVEVHTTVTRDALTASEAYNGKVIVNTTTGALEVRIAGAWVKAARVGGITIPMAWNYILPGDIKVPSGSTDYLPAALIDEPTTAVITLRGYRWSLAFGTSFTFSIVHTSGTLVAGVVATSAGVSGSGSFGPINAGNGDLWRPVVTAVSGTPSGGAVALLADVTV